MKPVAFIGRALSELKAFPDAARREAGFQIFNLTGSHHENCTRGYFQGHRR